MMTSLCWQLAVLFSSQAVPRTRLPTQRWRNAAAAIQWASPRPPQLDPQGRIHQMSVTQTSQNRCTRLRWQHARTRNRHSQRPRLRPNPCSVGNLWRHGQQHQNGRQHQHRRCNTPLIADGTQIVLDVPLGVALADEHVDTVWQAERAAQKPQAQAHIREKPTEAQAAPTKRRLLSAGWHCLYMVLTQHTTQTTTQTQQCFLYPTSHLHHAPAVNRPHGQAVERRAHEPTPPGNQVGVHIHCGAAQRLLPQPRLGHKAQEQAALEERAGDGDQQLLLQRGVGWRDGGGG